MDQLWAPWRLSYVTTPKTTTAPDECFICRGLGENDDRANLIALRTPRSVVILNRFPYNNGHLLVAPHDHKASLRDLDEGELLDGMKTIQLVLGELEELMQPQGFNVGLNLGKAAGAGLPGHLHWHVVPRWTGDTNFMPVVADVRIIVQALETLYDLLTPRLNPGGGGS